MHRADHQARTGLDVHARDGHRRRQGARFHTHGWTRAWLLAVDLAACGRGRVILHHASWRDDGDTARRNRLHRLPGVRIVQGGAQRLPPSHRERALSGCGERLAACGTRRPDGDVESADDSLLPGVSSELHAAGIHILARCAGFAPRYAFLRVGTVYLLPDYPRRRFLPRAPAWFGKGHGLAQARLRSHAHGRRGHTVHAPVRTVDCVEWTYPEGSGLNALAVRWAGNCPTLKNFLRPKSGK